MDPTGATSAARFLPLGTEVAASAGPGPLRHVETTGSTNDDLAAEARAGDASACVLVTDHQTAGRGRLDRTWEDAAGESLLMSVRLPAPAEDAPALVRALGAAARAAVDAWCRDPVLAKWPNDLVVVDGPAPGKLSGMLAELVEGPEPCVVIGLGINIRPIGSFPGATSVVECGGADDRDGLLAAILRQFAVRRGDDAAVLDEMRANSATVGTRVRVDLPGGREIVGEARDLTSSGELVVRTDDGREQVVGAGDVVHLRSL